MRPTKKQMEEFKKRIENWKSDEDDKEMAKVYEADRKDLMKVYKLLQQGKIEDAEKVVYDLDTIVREKIPNAIYNLITKDNS